MKRLILAGMAALLLYGPAQGFGAASSVTVYNPSGVRFGGRFVDELLKESMEAQGVKHPARANDFPRGRTEKIRVRKDELAEINEIFYERGWTDGLPIVPPTKERVEAMLGGTDYSADFVVAELAPLNGEATVEKIAVNAVMAGCEPKHLPVLIAAMEVVGEEAFDLRGWSSTTNPDSLLLVLSGPIVKELGVNAGTNSFGRGWKPNATLSRAMNLALQNIGGSWPGVTDMSTLGQPGEFVMFFAENAEANPWAPFHTQFGHPAGASVVTLAAVEGYSGILGIGQSREGFLKLVANWMRGHDRPYRPAVFLAIARDTAAMLAREGWNRESMTDFIREQAKVPMSEFKEQFIDTNMAKKGVPAWVFQEKNPDRLIPKPFFDRLIIVVAGGTGEKSLILPCWTAGTPVSNQIRLPAHWAELIK